MRTTLMELFEGLLRGLVVETVVALGREEREEERQRETAGLPLYRVSGRRLLTAQSNMGTPTAPSLAHTWYYYLRKRTPHGVGDRGPHRVEWVSKVSRWQSNDDIDQRGPAPRGTPTFAPPIAAGNELALPYTNVHLDCRG